MKERERLKERRAITPVVSALILSAIVLTVGGVLWAYSQSAMTISAEDYAESVINMTATISERFIIEHVAYINDDPMVWIYNYGNVDIDVKIEVKNNGVSVTYPTDPKEWIPMNAGGFKNVEINYPPVSGELIIHAYTRRGNNVNYMFLVPS